MPMLTASEIADFQTRGIIQRRGFLPDEKVSHARAAVRQRLEAAGLWKEGVWYPESWEALPTSQAGAKLVRGLNRRREIAELIGEEAGQTVAQLLQNRATFSIGPAQILFSLPNALQWTLPHDLWHIDFPRLPDGDLPGVQIFTFLETVAPGGGGTLVVAGSHRLINGNQRLGSQQVRGLLRREPYFRDLMSPDAPDRSRFMEQSGSVGDVELRVVELSGEPGDVYFTDLRLLHTIAPNAARVPRIMLTQRFVLETLREALIPSPVAGQSALKE